MATPLRHQNLNIFVIFVVPQALLHCHVVVVAKQKTIVACPALQKMPNDFLSFRYLMGCLAAGPLGSDGPVLPYKN